MWCLYLVQHILDRIKASQYYTYFQKLISFVMQSSTSEVEVSVLENSSKVFLRGPWKVLEFYTHLSVWTSISNTSLFLCLNKKVVIRADNNKLLAEKQTGKTLIRLLLNIWVCTVCQATSVHKFRITPVNQTKNWFSIPIMA